MRASKADCVVSDSQKEGSIFGAEAWGAAVVWGVGSVIGVNTRQGAGLGLEIHPTLSVNEIPRRFEEAAGVRRLTAGCWGPMLESHFAYS